MGDCGQVHDEIGRATEGGVDGEGVFKGRVGEDVVMPRFSRVTTAAPERRAMSRQMSEPEGARAECGNVRPNASAMTWLVAAVPRNWQPPPGEAQALQPASAASA
jgi:hypothetical protein